MRKKIAIIGAGASAFMAAITAAERLGKTASITIYEKNNSTLNKVRISGGGRCNVTHDESNPRLFAKNYPRGANFMKKILGRFSQNDTIAWFEKHGVQLKIETDGRMFPTTNDSQTIIDCLYKTAKSLGVEIITSQGMTHFSIHENGYMLHFQNGTTEIVDVLHLATGGHPKRSGFDWLSDHGINIVDPLPSLFTFRAPACPFRALMGIAVPKAMASIQGTKLAFDGPVLLTHWGFSGPAILKLSAWGARHLAEKNYHFDLKINWLPDWSQADLVAFFEKQKTTEGKRQIGKYGLFDFPKRLWHLFLSENGIPNEKKWQDISKKEYNRLIESLTNSIFPIRGKSTFKEEFVTAGGVALSEINPKTMEHKRLPNLFFSGEVLDVDGITGGFNFQAAWSTGFVAGSSYQLKRKRT